MSTGRLTVLVTGATGFVGSHTTRALLDAGHRVRAFVRSPEKAERVLGQHEGLEVAQGDIGDANSVRDALRGCNAVIHSAAIVAVGIAGNPEELLEANVAGVRNVIGAAIDAGIPRIVHVSSLATLFQGDGSAPSEESEPYESKLPYGHSKTMAEGYVREQQAAGHPVKIVYPSAIIGPDDPGFTEPLNALKTFIEDFIPITTSGMQFVDVRDVALAHVRIVETTPGPARYMVSGTFLPWPELNRALEAASGRKLRAVPFPAPLLRATGRFLELARKLVRIELPLTSEAAAYVTSWGAAENSSALIEMGVSFRDVQVSIDETVQWMRENGYLSS